MKDIEAYITDRFCPVTGIPAFCTLGANTASVYEPLFVTSFSGGVVVASPAMSSEMVGQVVLGTPSNQRLRQLAMVHQPPPEWFEGEEEGLF